MNSGFRVCAGAMIVSAACLLLVSPAVAQWLHYPTAGVPKNKDGKPNLDAPAPRTADGKPDFSGMWVPAYISPREAQFLAAGTSQSPAARETGDDENARELGNIGWGLKDGLPFTPWAAELRKTRIAQFRVDDPLTSCLPAGVVGTHTDLLYKKWIQVPGLIAILSERNADYRQIFTDGRPMLEDPQPTWNGYSTGKWEGDTLVVHSNGFRDDGWLDRGGSPSTESMKLTERIRRPTYGRMEIEMTVDDPKAYTKPWTVTSVQKLALNTELLGYYCVENEKDRKHLTRK